MTSQVQVWRKFKWPSVVVIGLLVAVVVYSTRFRVDPVTNKAAEAISTAKPIPAPAGFAEQFLARSSDKGKDQGQADEPASGHALDPVLELARKALTQIQTEVDDYTGRLIKRERIKGVLGNEVQMDFKIRTRREVDGKIIRPLSAYLKFLEPKSARGREVIWIEGANGNKLTGHEGGFLNLVRVELEPTGMLAMMDNKYPITEIGLTRLVEKLIEKGERDRLVGPCEVQIVEDQRVGDRTCQLIQVTHPKPDPRYDFHIAQIFIDTDRMIPLRYAAFLWPTEVGGEPLLEEEYTYLDLKLNVGLTDSDFDPDNKAYNYP
ncbi:MAG: DUF1571 domain-containing protein [Pirellulaceae bacterium]|nr:DUF1571 domain-containing protein [Pirellulaceae bacterium]